MYKDLNAIEYVSMRVVRVEGLITSHLSVSVVPLHHVVIDDDRERAAHNLIVHHYHHLSLREDSKEFLNLCPGPKHIRSSIDTSE